MKYNDTEIFALIEQEIQRQQTTINLIASENYASPQVLQASASVFANKYAEGYPGKRYYSGCVNADKVELIAQDRCKELFGAEHVNVQPHAGSPANLAVYFSVLKPGDVLMGMSLAEGGHLTHGHSVNFSGTLYQSISYSVDPQTEQLDYNQIEKLALQHKPKLLVAGASAYSRIIDFERLAHIAHKAGGLFMADIAHIAGLVAAGLHPSPIPYADFVTSTTHKTLRGPRGGLIMCKKQYAELIDKAIMPGTQGGPFINNIAAKAVAFHEALQPEFKTYQEQVIKNAQALASAFQERGYRIVADGTDNHLFILDLRNKNISGRQAELALENAGITVSRSCIPFDPAKPWITSGIRLGTPALTTRGMKEGEMKGVAECIDRMITIGSESLSNVQQIINQLCSKFPLFY